MERIVSKRDDFVVYALFCFELVQRFEYRGDMFSGSSYCASKGVFAVAGDEIFVFAVSLVRVSFNSLI